MFAMQLIIEPGGGVRCIYEEAIALSVLGPPVIRRASLVEPDCDGQWYADLAPVGGPRLGGYVCRSQALAAEYAWLEVHWLTGLRSEG